MIEVVPDASALVKVLVDEPGSERAYAILDEADVLVAPACILSETANALWKHVRWRELPLENAQRAFNASLSYGIEIIAVEDLLPEAFALACELPHPVYDCLYVLLALHGGRTLVTADARMREAARALGVKVEWVGA